jgi:phage-related protein
MCVPNVVQSEKEIISMNEVEWNKKALKEVKSFPEEIKKELGYLIFKLQIGESLNMPYSRTMTSIAKRAVAN